MELTNDVLSLIGADERATLEASLEEVRAAALPLFEPRCLISGDPNPANWGVRENGSLVLYDWERCTCGTPAIDLAITVPGLGDRSAFGAVAREYLGPETGEDPRQLAVEIARAKVWSVTEFLAHYAREAFTPSVDVRPLIASYPDWLGTLKGEEG